MTALFEWDDIEIPTQGKSNEWYTPARYVEAARKVMGSIDLDPASCEMANRTVKATRYYTERDNGLTQKWDGRVWLNPPYGRTNNKSNIGIFTTKLVDEYESGNVTQAILLSTCRPDTPWFHRLWQYPICFADHRIYFYLPTNRGDDTRLDMDSGHFHGTLFVYFGPNEQAFIDIFSEFGSIARRVSSPKSKVAPLSLWEALP